MTGTHAGSAADLWRKGVTHTTLCVGNKRPFITVSPGSVNVGRDGATFTSPGASVYYDGSNMADPGILSFGLQNKLQIRH